MTTNDKTELGRRPGQAVRWCPMTPELIARVDAWLDARGDWSAATDDRSCLACDWADQSKRPLDPGVRAMLSGILLALVREAWGDPHFALDADVGPGKSAIWYGVLRYTPSGGWVTRFLSKGPSEAEALVAALEAAPEVA